jgi:tetrahydromethanopterin S-methyltransferase subunit B
MTLTAEDLEQIKLIVKEVVEETVLPKLDALSERMDTLSGRMDDLSGRMDALNGQLSVM